MPLPTVTVAGTINAPDGTPLTNKTVTFKTTAEMVDATGNVLVPIQTVTGKIVAGQMKAADGTTALSLYASDTGTTTVPYTIRESWSTREFTVNLLTTDQVSGHIVYSTLGPVSPAPTATSPYAELSDVEARDAATLTAAEAHSDAGDTAEAIARTTAIATAVAPLATTTALTSEATTRAAADTANANAITAETTARSNADAAEVIARNTAIATAVAGLINGAPGALDTLKELADAINDDASFAASVTTALAGKQPLDSDLTAIAALSTTAFGRAFLTMADAAATKTALALGNVDNTSDVNKPVSTAQAAALAAWPPIQSTAPDPATTHLWIDTTVDPTAYQPLDSDLTAIAALAPADGQLLQWSNGLGAWTVVNPTGSSELAYAENATGTAQTSINNASGNTNLTNMTISVSPTSRPVYMTASADVQVTSGTSDPLLKIIETTGGASTLIESSFYPFTTLSQPGRIVIPLFRLAASVASTRTFALQIFVPAAGAGVVSVLHSATSRTTLLALAA